MKTKTDAAGGKSLEDTASFKKQTNEENTVETVVGELLKDRNLNLSVAESCTGGLISHRITNVPGSSAYFKMGIIAYTPEAKMRLLQVAEQMLAREGIVSRETALAMARGVKIVSGSDFAIGVTGTAGPDGGNKEKPIGTVYIAVISGEKEYARRFNFAGFRENIKEQAAAAALNMLKSMLSGRSNFTAG